MDFKRFYQLGGSFSFYCKRMSYSYNRNFIHDRDYAYDSQTAFRLIKH